MVWSYSLGDSYNNHCGECLPGINLGDPWNNGCLRHYIFGSSVVC